MLSRHNPIDVERKLAAASPVYPFPPASYRLLWQETAEAVGPETVREIIAQAEEDAASEIPSLTATMYLDFDRSGAREGYSVPCSRRRQMLCALTLAECLEGRGRFVDAAMNVIWAICEESSWAMPAHQRGLAHIERPHLDLGAAITALDLAEARLLLGGQLCPEVGRRIVYEVERRCIEPLLTRHDYWWMCNTEGRTVNNWTAVCFGGVVAAALYIEPDRGRLAELVARAARSLDDYLSGFGRDGGSEEGAGYWSFGFGYFTILAQLVEQFSQGAIEFMGEEIVGEIARYPLRVTLSRGAYVSFSDSPLDHHFNPAHLAWLSRRLDIPDLMRLAREEPGPAWRRSLAWGLRSLMWRPSAEPEGRFVPARHDWLPDLAWMVSRYDPEDPDALVLAARGGSNGESHNHNDLGSVIVRTRGESLITDPGRGRYVKSYFSAGCYELLARRSLGHSVPLPNGVEQAAGSEYRAEVLAHEANADADRLSLELKDAYPSAADLASLQRTVTLHREAPRGWVELVDEARFGPGGGTLECQLVTLGEVDVVEDGVVIRGARGALRITSAGARVTARVETEEGAEFSDGPKDLRRVVFAPAGGEDAIALRIEPC